VVSGLLTAAGPDPASAEFELAEGTYEVLVDETSPAYLGGLADVVAAAGRVLPLLADAYRTGAGVPYAAYGPDGVSAQSALNRPSFVNAMVSGWLPQLPDVLTRLRDEADPARVADLACGTGWAGIELAKAFPHITVDGLDNDEASIARGRQYAADHGVADRVDLEVTDLADESAGWSPRYDWCSSSSACTTSRGRSRYCGTLAPHCGRAVRCWSWTSGQPRASPRPVN